MMAKVTDFKGWHKGYTVEQLVTKNDLRVIHVEDVNSLFVIELLKGVDIILSFSIPQKLEKEILFLPSFGCITVHSGKLSKCRGLLPTFWQMLCGDKGYRSIHIL